MNGAGLLAVGVLALTSCSSSGGRAVPPSEASDIAPSSALPTTSVSSSVHPIPTPHTTVANTTVPLTTVAPSTTTTAASTVAPAVSAFCTQLTSEPYAVRRALVTDPASRPGSRRGRLCRRARLDRVGRPCRAGRHGDSRRARRRRRRLRDDLEV